MTYWDWVGRTRRERAQRMYDDDPAHHIVYVLRPTNIWIVRSQRFPRDARLRYRVDPAAGTCTCPDYQQNAPLRARPGRRFLCKHLYLVALVQSRGRVLRAGDSASASASAREMMRAGGVADTHPIVEQRARIDNPQEVFDLVLAWHNYVAETGAPAVLEFSELEPYVSEFGEITNEIGGFGVKVSRTAMGNGAVSYLIVMWIGAGIFDYEIDTGKRVRALDDVLSQFTEETVTVTLESREEERGALLQVLSEAAGSMYYTSVYAPPREEEEEGARFRPWLGELRFRRQGLVRTMHIAAPRRAPATAGAMENEDALLTIGVRAPKPPKARDLRPVAAARVKLAAVTKPFAVFAAVKDAYANDKAFIVRPGTHSIAMKLKGSKNSGESESRFKQRMNRVAVDYAKEIEASANIGVPEFAQPFRDAGFAAVVVRIDPSAAAADDWRERKFKPYRDMIEEIISNVVDDDDNIVGGLPWASPYTRYPPMNFFRLYTAVRRRKRDPDAAASRGLLTRDLGLRYRKINMLRLQSDSSVGLAGLRPVAAGATAGAFPFYLTERQATALGGTPLPGARRIGLVFWKIGEDPEGTKTMEERMRAGVAVPFRVVRVDEVAGDAFQRKVREVAAFLAGERFGGEKRGEEVIDSAEALLTQIGLRDPSPTVETDATQIPMYNPANDAIAMPPRAAFVGPAEEYYNTLFHEMVHWTGSARRLNRRALHLGHTQTYNKEELVAEIGAYLLASEAGIAAPLQKNSEAYVRSWVRRLEKKRFWLSAAARLAFEAFEYLLEHHFTTEKYAGDAELIEADDADDAAEYGALSSMLQGLNRVLRDATAELPTKDALVESVRGELEAGEMKFIPQHILNEFTAVDALETVWRDKTAADVRERLRGVIQALTEQLEAVPVPEAAEGSLAQAPQTGVVGARVGAAGRDRDPGNVRLIAKNTMILGRADDVTDGAEVFGLLRAWHAVRVRFRRPVFLHYVMRDPLEYGIEPDFVLYISHNTDGPPGYTLALSIGMVSLRYQLVGAVPALDKAIEGLYIDDDWEIALVDSTTTDAAQRWAVLEAVASRGLALRYTTHAWTSTELWSGRLILRAIPERHAEPARCHADGCALGAEFRCAGCRAAQYCSLACQADAWEGHADRCSPADISPK